MATAAKRKKGEVAIGDFDLDTLDVSAIRNERTQAAKRVDAFNQNFTPTGDVFKDIDLRSGTSRDVKSIRQADLLLDKASDRGATVRGQDIQLELGRGELGVNTERNRITEKYYDQNYEVEKGGLGLNRDIFNQSVARYKKYGEPMDKINTTNAAIKSKYVADEIGIKGGTAFNGLTPEFYASPKEEVAKAPDTVQATTAKPFEPQYEDEYEPTTLPDWLEPKPYSDYGDSVPSQMLGITNEIAKVPFRATNMALDFMEPLATSLGGPARQKLYKRKTGRRVIK